MVAATLTGTAAADPLAPGSTLCLRPIELPLDEQEGEGRRLQLQQRLRDALTAASFKVPDPQALKDVLQRVEKETGGFVDTATGGRDERRYQAFTQQRVGALRRELGCEAELRAHVTRVQARFVGGTASWDGTSQSVSSAGRQVLNVLGGVVESGWVAALSLWLHVTDLEGNDLAFRTAGIECLASLAVVRDQDVLPSDLWLTDGTKIDVAIQSALGPNGDALRHRGTPAAFSAVEPQRAEEEIRRALGRPPRSDPR